MPDSPSSPGFIALRRRYLDSFPDKIAALQAAREKEDCEKVVSLLHQLAGSSGSYGFPELSERCQALELEVINNRNDLTRAKQMLEDLLDLMKGIHRQHQLEKKI